MLDTLERVDTRVDIRLEWEEHDGPRCDSAHLYSPGFCTVEAKYAVVNKCSRLSGLWCEARYKEFLKTAETRMCRTCRKFLFECWKVRPL